MTWVTGKVGPFGSSRVSLEGSCREKHDDAKIIDLRSTDIDIFWINTLKIFLCDFLVLSVGKYIILHEIFASLAWHLAAIDRRHTYSKVTVLLLCLLQAWILSEL